MHMQTILRDTALNKANKYYGIFREGSKQSLDIQEDCLEISFYYFNIYFICLKQDIEKHWGFKFLKHDYPNTITKEDLREGTYHMEEMAFSGIPLLEKWEVVKKGATGEAIVQKETNPFYNKCKELFESEKLKHSLESLIEDFDKNKLTQVLLKDNQSSFLSGLKKFKNGKLDCFSFLFYRVRNHMIHASKNLEDERNHKIMKEMCMVLSEYTKTIQELFNEHASH